MARFYVRQVVTQTLVYLVDDAKDEADAISQVNGGQAPIAYEENGAIASTQAKRDEKGAT